MIPTSFNRLGTVNNPLPENLQELEYIVFTGRQYINTGLSFSDDFGYDYTADWEAGVVTLLATNTFPVIGVFFGIYASTTSGLLLFDANNTNIQVEPPPIATTTTYYAVNAADATVVYGADIRYEGVVNRITTLSVVIVGVTQRTLNMTPTPTASYSDGFKGRLRRWRGYRNNKLISDMIPCMDIDNNKPCFFDVIRNEIFYNQGPDDFVPGPPINTT